MWIYNAGHSFAYVFLLCIFLSFNYKTFNSNNPPIFFDNWPLEEKKYSKFWIIYANTSFNTNCF